MANLIEWGTGVILWIISTTSYPGIVGLMALESACVPVPSEIVMPFGGALAYGLPDYPQLDIWLVGLAGTIGCLLGSLMAYYIGSHVGRPALLKYGKYLLLSKNSLERTEEFFEKRGDITVFVSRLLPVIRTFISLPAGIARMDVKKFAVYTFAGSLPWCYALTYVGYWLGPNWEDVIHAFRGFDIIVIIGLVIFIIWYIWYLKKE
jgi:membrane protein DedA with SNARE-associated domain